MSAVAITDFTVQPLDTFIGNVVGAWSDVPMSTYQDLPGESNSLLALLARSPKRYQLTRDGLISKPESTHDQLLGTLIHAAVNEGKEPQYYLRPDTYAAPESPKKGALLVNKPWNMNANYCQGWVAARQDKPILTALEAIMLNSVTAEVLENKRATKLLAGAWREVTACAYNDNLDLPYLLRVRFDAIGRNDDGWYWIETKSTRDASTWAFSREILKRMYHVQTALYRRVLRKLSGDDEPRCYMIAIEKDPTVPRVNVRQLMPAAMDMGDKILDERLALLKRCRLSNSWPALVDEEEGDHIPMIDLPAHAYGKVEDLSGLTEVLDDEKEVRA